MSRTLPPDYHMHTPLCRHAVGEPWELATHALEVGLTEIGFSDHSPMRRDDFDDWRMRFDQLAEYVDKVREAQRRFPQLTIRLALEVDYLPGHEDWIRHLAASYPWDYFIGSVHYVFEDWAIDSPFQLAKWRERPAIEVWTAYFRALTMAVESGLFDIVGHADLCKKFAIYPQEDCFPEVEKFLQAVKRQGIAIEINTAGLRKDCRELYPSDRILCRAAELEIPLTFGSDAHAPEEVGLNFAEGIQAAKRAGYGKSCVFEQRKRREIPILG